MYGLASVPAPLPPLHDTAPAGPPKTSPTVDSMLTVDASPPDAWTVSLRPVICTVSCAVSTSLSTCIEQVYGSPTVTGLEHDLVNETSWTSVGAGAVVE